MTALIKKCEFFPIWEMKKILFLFAFILFGFSGLSQEPKGSLVTRDVFIKSLAVPSRGIEVVAAPSVTATILFKYDSTEIAGPDSMKQLEEVAAAFKSHELKDYKFIVEGHTDGKGEAGYNQSLSEKRAAAIIKMLEQSYGISTERLYSVGRGEKFPVGDNETEDGRQKNRRVVFITDTVGIQSPPPQLKTRGLQFGLGAQAPIQLPPLKELDLPESLSAVDKEAIEKQMNEFAILFTNNPKALLADSRQSRSYLSDDYAKELERTVEISTAQGERAEVDGVYKGYEYSLYEDRREDKGFVIDFAYGLKGDEVLAGHVEVTFILTENGWLISALVDQGNG